ncbi:hypothetical protein Scep_030604 [Stephania cephalantha]|uniref:Reverse transcriptase domain-containing protein n=1 Tax=Stephania cephalantha TaxID=152367 RepID=A0AAP0HDA6_9MAGN
MIVDNVLVAFETLHAMRCNKHSKYGNAALKIDISKAYDRVDWGFLRAMLLQLGFSSRWVDLVMLFVNSVTFSICLNGDLLGPIAPERGLRQGCPLSPYLFILCSEGLSALLAQANLHGKIHGCRVIRNAPVITHLLFADDSFLFFRASVEEAMELKGILDTYEKASGQAINFQKSALFFSPNVADSTESDLRHCLGVNADLVDSNYLGLPSLIGRGKCEIFAFLKSRLWKRLTSWNHRFFSQAGKEILLKSIAQAIPTYCMSAFLLPITVTDALQKMMNSFWWGMKPDGGKKMHWMSWHKLCVRKEDGGLGFKDLRSFNLAMLAKQGWRLLTQPDALASRVLKAKYYPRGDLLNAKIGHNPSFTWRGIYAAKGILVQGCRWKVGSGCGIKVWADPWLKDSANFYITTDRVAGMEDMTVNELMIPNQREWDTEMIEENFNPRDCDLITRVLLNRGGNDELIWHFSKNGVYSVSSGYRVALGMGSESDLQRVGGDWQRLWSLKIPSTVKFFIWRFFAGPAFQSERAFGVERLTMDVRCALCDSEPESRDHLFRNA